MTDNKYHELPQIIRDAGGIVHSDGNIFFKNAEVFMAAADRAMRAAEPAPVEGPSDEMVTEEMVAAGAAAAREYMERTGGNDPAVIYRAMRSVAPNTQPQEAAPSQDEALRLFDAGWKAAAQFCNRDDVIADGLVGGSGCPRFEEAFNTARKQEGK